MVELVNKLQERGLLGDDLLHTINGREYLTVDRLRQEVASAVTTSGGRIPVVCPSPVYPSVAFHISPATRGYMAARYCTDVLD